MKNQILDLIEKKEFLSIRNLLKDVNDVDIADILEELDVNELLITFRLLPKNQAVNVFTYLSANIQEKIINSVTDKEIKYLIDELYFDDMIDLLEEMPSNIVKKILANVKEQDRHLVNQFLNYPDNTAGSLMTIEYVDLKRDKTVKEALAYIKKVGVDRETIYTCYIIDKNRKLEGIVSLRELVVSDDDKKIEEIMSTDYIYVNTHDDQEEIAQKFKKYDFLAMPVVDKENRLVGIITVDDIIDVIDEEFTEDMYKMAAMTPTDEDYLNAGTFQLAKHRISWLLILMLSATLTGFIIQRYEAVLSSVLLLSFSIPLLMDTGGNAGSQSATVVIRGLALGNIRIKDYLRVLFTELKVSVIVGIVLASVNFSKMMLVDIIIYDVTIPVAFTVSVTLFLVIVLSKVIGGLLPIVASKFKLDPAIMASPLITTIVDAFALVIYFQLAKMFLNI